VKISVSFYVYNRLNVPWCLDY